MLITRQKLSRRCGALTAAFISGGLTVALGVSSSAAPIPVRLPVAASATISGHVPDLVKESASLGALAPGQALLFSVTLPLRNQAELADLLKGQNDPNDARYGQYLTPAQFAERFGPTQSQYNALIAYLQSKGITVTQTFPSRTYVSLSGTVSQANAAFGVAIKQFQAPDGRIFHAPDTEVKVPASIAGYVSAVTGLDDATPPVPLVHSLRHIGLSHVKAFAPSPDAAAPLVQNPGEQGTGPQGGFAPKDFRTAYGLSGSSLNGAGQTIAIIEYGTTFNIKDALKYENQFSLPRAPITIVPVDGGSTSYATDGPTETDLDIDCQLSMAPGASLRVYLESSTGSTTDALNQVAADAGTIPSLRQLSVSYGFGSESSTRTTPSASQTALNTAYTMLAAAGVSTYVSAGDSGSQADSNGRTSVDINASIPMVCSVGGTALIVQSPGSNENYLAESTWNYNNTAAGGAGGGGVSKQWTIAANAAYQTNAAKFASAVSGSSVSLTNRNVPDISCDASPETGAAVYVSNDPGEPGNGWTIIGGTSEAAPLWAGYTALINQNRLAKGDPVLGFPNNSLYPLAYTTAGLTAAYPTLFHDIADASSNLTVSAGTNYKAVTGYDASTGLGTMQGTNLITALTP